MRADTVMELGAAMALRYLLRPLVRQSPTLPFLITT
jgi:hypothetical protein